MGLHRCSAALSQLGIIIIANLALTLSILNLLILCQKVPSVQRKRNAKKIQLPEQS